MATHKISRTYDNGSGFYTARLASLRQPNPQSPPSQPLRVDFTLIRRLSVNGEFKHESKSFVVNRTIRLQFHRLATQLSSWLDAEEVPLDAKLDALVLLRDCYKSSRFFKQLKRVALSLEMTALEKEEMEDDGRECTVCLEGFSTGPHSRAMEIPCFGSHVFHGHCILGWLKKDPSCPLCRFKFDKDEIQDVYQRLGFGRTGPAILNC